MIVDLCIECMETYDSSIERLDRETMIAARRSNIPRSKGKLSKSSASVLPPKPTKEVLSRNPEGNPWIREKLTDESMTSTDTSFTSLAESSVEVVFVPCTYNPSPLSRKAASRIKQHRFGRNGFDEDTSNAPSKCETQHLSYKSSATPKKSLLHLAQKKTSKQVENKAKQTIVANEHHQTVLIAQSGVSRSLLERKAIQAIKLAKSRKSASYNRTKKGFNSSLEEESHCPKGSHDNRTSSEGIKVSLSSIFPSEKGIKQKKSSILSDTKEFSIALTTKSAVIMKEIWSDDELKQAAHRREVLLRAQSLMKD